MNDGVFRLVNGSAADQKQHVVPENVAQWRRRILSWCESDRADVADVATTST
jgi:hypothetical protein